MKCPECQFENHEDANFCNQCGYELKNAIKTYSENYNNPKSYTPNFLANKILKSKSSIEGERKFVTVLFADVANYTSMSEKLDPEDVHQIMDGCFKILVDEIHEHKGTINQFIGDGVMALFGAPLALEDHAQDACLASLAIQEATKKYSREMETKYDLKFQMRIGLNSGAVVVGSIGDDLRMDYTAIGDTTNLASRMESLAKPGTVLVSPNTYKKVRQQFELKSLGKTEIKGKEKPIEVYKLIKRKVYRPRLGQERQIYSEIVGRDNDLNTLELQVTKAVNGEGSVVNIIGEAGIGKSRLIAELKSSSVMKRVTLLEGRAISIGRNLSFHPIIDILKHWARIGEDDSEAAALGKLETAIKGICKEEANEIVPFIATLIGMKLSGRYAERVKGIEGEALEKLILKNVRDLLTKATQLTPLVVVMEDLHWADTSSIELLESLFRLAETQRILFINAFRPDHKETGDRIIETLKERLPVYYVEIDLEPLTEQMSEVLIDNMLNIKGVHYGIKNMIVKRAGGNPFFIEEVVRSFIDQGAIITKDGNFELTDKVEAMVIPLAINDVLMARLDRLEVETRRLVKVASVIGRNFFHRILSEVAKSVQDIDDRLSFLKDIQLIRERKKMDELEYLFKHALAHEAAYESILHQKRKEIHLQVAKSIEKVFEERLHEFYGMLALHYSKAEDYENAEQYLVKAGEEAIRSSASNEALNYYQEGLKLYLQYGKDTKDPEKLAMFEKNIAVALYNKAHWVESVEHFEKVLVYWNIDTVHNRVKLLFKFIKNIFVLIIGLDRSLKKKKSLPAQREEEIFALAYKMTTAMAYFDNTRLFFHMISFFNRIFKFGATKTSMASIHFFSTVSMFSYCSISHKIAHKLLELSQTIFDMNTIQNLMIFEFHSSTSKLCSGEWEKIEPFKKQLTDDALKKGYLWDVTNYMWTFGFAATEKGNFLAAEPLLQKLYHIESAYDYDLATVNGYIIRTDLFLKKNQLYEAQAEAQRGLRTSSQKSTEFHQLVFLSFSVESLARLDKLDEAHENLSKAKKIVDKEQFIMPIFLSPYLVAQFVLNIRILKQAMKRKDTSNLSELKKKAYQSGKTALKKLKKYAPYKTKTFRLMGDYYWLIGKENKAFKWWDRAVKKGEELGAQPDLSRTYFEIGKSLLNTKSNYKEWDNITADEYLQKARTMFEEMDLQYDLDELDKIAGSN